MPEKSYENVLQELAQIFQDTVTNILEKLHDKKSCEDSYQDVLVRFLSRFFQVVN